MTSPRVDADFALRYAKTIGLAAMEGRGFSNPVDLAIFSDDRIYVVSRTNPAQTFGIRVGICDFDENYFGDFGSYGSGDGQFIWPTALAFDSHDSLYLADEQNNRITVYDRSGRFVSKWGAPGNEAGELNGPSGLAFDSQDGLYVADHRNNRVQRFSRDGRFLDMWGAAGSAEGQLDLPWGVAVDSDDNVYVADWGNDRIQKFAADGAFLASFGESGPGDGQLNHPSGVAVDGDRRIYVADWGNERVQVFGPDGRFLLKLRGEATPSKWAEEFFVSSPHEKEAREKANLTPDLTEDVDTPYEESARIEHLFWGPVSVKLDRHGRLYVVETNRHRVQVFEPVR